MLVWGKTIFSSSDDSHKVNLNDFYPHFLHILEPNMMNKLVLKGDMDVTFAGIVDTGEILMLIDFGI